MCALLIVFDWRKIYFTLLSWTYALTRCRMSIKYLLLAEILLSIIKTEIYLMFIIYFYWNWNWIDCKNQGHFHHLHFSFMQEILTIILWEICRWQDLQIIGKFYAHWAHTFAIPIPIAFLSTFCSFHFFIFVEIVDTSWRVGSVGILYLDLDTVQNVKKS